MPDYKKELINYRIESAREKTYSAKLSKHAGVIAYFQKQYVKTGKFEKEYSKYLNGAFQIRNNCDYADFFLVSKEDAIEQYKRAEKFIKRVEEYLN